MQCNATQILWYMYQRSNIQNSNTATEGFPSGWSFHLVDTLSCSGMKQFLHFPCKKQMRCWFIQFVWLLHMFVIQCWWMVVAVPSLACCNVPTWTGSYFRLCCSKVLYRQNKKRLQPTIRPLLESMVQILRHRPMTHAELLKRSVAILLPILGGIVTISSELSAILVAFQGCWQFQYIWSSYTHLMVTTRGMGYFIPYQY